MSEMVERVAKAIGEHVHIISGSCDLQNAARAAIEAMREATEAMVTAGYVEKNAYHEIPPAQVWQAMIDAALVTEPAA